MQQTQVVPPTVAQPVTNVSVSSAPVMQPPTQVAATQSKSSTSETGEARFKLPGKTAKVTAAEFQVVVDEYAEKSRTTNPKVDKFVYPLKAGTKDYDGINVFGCFGSYKSDEYCIKCPLRKNCIINR